MALPSDPIQTIHQCVEQRRYRIGWHALQHMFEEGFDTIQLQEALSGRLTVLEEYEADSRVLVLGTFRFSRRTTCPLHAVCDFLAGTGLDVVTAYIPKPPHWIDPRHRGRVK